MFNPGKRVNGFLIRETSKNQGITAAASVLRFQPSWKLKSFLLTEPSHVLSTGNRMVKTGLGAR